MKENAFLRFFICLVIVVFFIHQFYSSVYKPISTESAEFYEAVNGLNITGTIIRQESVITCNKDGVLHFVASDGSRVAKGGTVAKIYDSESASLTMSRIDSIKEKISDIKEIQGYNNQQAADLELINNKVNDALNNMVLSCSRGNYENFEQTSAVLLSALNRRQMITGEKTDFSAELKALKSELKELEGSLPSAKGSVKAKMSGYFVSSEDGYENVLKCGNIEKLTPEFLSNAKPEKLPENAIGKIVSDYEWFIAARISINDSLKYKEGDALTIKTTLKDNPELPVTVKKINVSKDSDSAAVIFSCRQMSSELASMRTGYMTVVSKTYKGLKIPKKSLRVVKGKTGVYVVSGITIKFVPVEVIYSTDDYIICEQRQSNEDTLRLYDEVVVKGKNLYDGKIAG